MEILETVVRSAFPSPIHNCAMILATYDGTPQAGSANSDSLGHRLRWVCRPGVVGDASTSGEVWPGDDAHACTGGFSNGAIRDDVGARPRRDAASARFGAGLHTRETRRKRIGAIVGAYFERARGVGVRKLHLTAISAGGSC